MPTWREFRRNRVWAAQLAAAGAAAAHSRAQVARDRLAAVLDRSDPLAALFARAAGLPQPPPPPPPAAGAQMGAPTVPAPLPSQATLNAAVEGQRLLALPIRQFDALIAYLDANLRPTGRRLVLTTEGGNNGAGGRGGV
jgi:hypothetical protein